jgi:hypothetical protein
MKGVGREAGTTVPEGGRRDKAIPSCAHTLETFNKVYAFINTPDDGDSRLPLEDSNKDSFEKGGPVELLGTLACQPPLRASTRPDWFVFCNCVLSSSVVSPIPSFQGAFLDEQGVG